MGFREGHLTFEKGKVDDGPPCARGFRSNEDMTVEHLSGRGSFGSTLLLKSLELSP